ncbi:MAG: hypothetical protein IPG60_06670 [Bacteroidetes bacterium]|nr:hypothetical protein [Bacteroidota bacterium]
MNPSSFSPPHPHPFGMLTPGRNWSAGSEYRFGFNGKESDAETYGEGNIYDYGFRIYNSRLGKFLSVDPLTQSYPWFTPYQFAGNKPIVAIDLDGMEEYVIIDRATATGNEIVLKSVYDFKGHLVNQERVINGNNYSNHKILVIKFDDAGKQQFETYENIADLSGNHQLVFEAIVSKRIEGEFQPNEGKKKYENATLITQSILISNKENNIKLPPPSLKIQFVGGKDDFISIEDARKQIVPVVDYLNTNPDSKIHITGHTGADNSLLKEGNSSNILSQVTEGEYNTIGELQIGRAQAVEGLLIEKGIDPNRITVGTGTQRSSDANRRVGIKIMDNE